VSERVVPVAEQKSKASSRPARSEHILPFEDDGDFEDRLDSDSDDEVPVSAVATTETASRPTSAAAAVKVSREAKIREARLKGYEGDPCPNCQSFTLVRNGTCLKC